MWYLLGQSEKSVTRVPRSLFYLLINPRGTCESGHQILERDMFKITPSAVTAIAAAILTALAAGNITHGTGISLMAVILIWLTWILGRAGK